MAWKLIGLVARAYMAYSRAVDALCRDLKIRFQRELDIAENVLMSLPMIALVLWLIGVR